MDPMPSHSAKRKLRTADSSNQGGPEKRLRSQNATHTPVGTTLEAAAPSPTPSAHQSDSLLGRPDEILVPGETCIDLLTPHINPAAEGAVNQVLHAHVLGGHVTVAGRDVHHHTHYHRVEPEGEVAIPKILHEIPNFRQIHIATLGKATKGTGEWIRTFQGWAIWLDAQGSLKIIWGYGMPGAGKTVLASLVIKALEGHAKSSPNPTCVCYIYFRYSDHTMATVQVFLETLVKQTLERHPSCQPLFDEVYARHIREQTRPTEEELLELLGKFANIMVTFYVLDALDEAPTKIQLDIVEKLASLNIKLFITSRPMETVQAAFPDAHCFPVSAQDKDLDLHITQEISRSANLRSTLDQDPSVRVAVFATIKEKCGGMFLHASLQLAALQECDSVHEMEEALAAFPNDIEELYPQTWQRILSQTKARVLRAKQVLVWVLNATRSLTLEELQYAVATCPDTYRFEKSRIVQDHTLLGACRGLVAVEEETKLVRLVHYTAKDVLRRLIVEAYPHPHAHLSEICMARLTGCGIHRSTISSKDELEKTLHSHPFLKYGYDSWSAHARQSLSDPPATLRCAEFVQSCHSLPVLPRIPFVHHLGPLHVVAFFNLPLALAGPTNLQNSNSETEKRGQTALHIACERGSMTAAGELLRLPNVRVNAVDSWGNTPLALSIIHGHENMVSLLLGHPETDVNARGISSKAPLDHIFNPKSFPNAVMENPPPYPPIDLSLVSDADESPLTLALGRGYEGMIQLLLSHPGIHVTPRELEAAQRSWGSAEVRDRTILLQEFMDRRDIDVDK